VSCPETCYCGMSLFEQLMFPIFFPPCLKSTIHLLFLWIPSWLEDSAAFFAYLL
jgi:hypothetical protein